MRFGVRDLPTMPFVVLFGSVFAGYDTMYVPDMVMDVYCTDNPVRKQYAD